MSGAHFTPDEIDELSRVYYDRVSAGQLLLRSGYPCTRVPMNAATALEYWGQVGEDLQEGQRKSILSNAALDYPANYALRSFLEG